MRSNYRQYFIYLITRDDGQQYIGTTDSKCIRTRMSAHRGTARFRGHTFCHEIIFAGKTPAAHELEPYFIEKYDTFRNGLNESIDGKGNHHAPAFTTRGYRFAAESLKKMQQAWKNRKPRTGWKHSEETKKKFSEARKDQPKGTQLNEQSVVEAVPNNRYEILTPTGFKPFAGIRKQTRKSTWRVEFSDGSEINGTGNHPVLTPSGWCTLYKLKLGDAVLTADRRACLTVMSKRHQAPQDVYDPIGVEGDAYVSGPVISHNCSFLSAQDTLIDGITLARLAHEQPIANIGSMRMYRQPEKGRIYVMTIDTSLGVGQNNSAFSIIDVTETPYRVVASYSDNKTVPTIFAEHCMAAAKAYNNAYTLIEITDIGQEVVSIFRYEYEYENIITIQNKPRQGQNVVGGFSKQTSWGVKTTVAVKKIGCATVKTLLENDQLLIPDWKTISEFTTFIRRKASYEAADGMTDDSVMTLVLFGWLTTQQYFIQLTDVNIRAQFLKEEQEKNSGDFVPFGIVNDGETVSAPVMPGETESQVNEDGWMGI